MVGVFRLGHSKRETVPFTFLKAVVRSEFSPRYRWNLTVSRGAVFDPGESRTGQQTVANILTTACSTSNIPTQEMKAGLTIVGCVFSGFFIAIGKVSIG
jgi:hypothetical protein